VTVSRRGFLAATAAAGAALAPGIRLVELALARDPAEAVTTAQRWGLLIDASKCADGCSSCVDACHTENGITSHGRPETDPQWIRKVTVRDRHTSFTQSFPMMCQHCEEPPCVDVCPTGASFRRADGIVLVDRHICIGCRYCMMACPYKARSFVHEDLDDQVAYVPRGKGCVESCTLCVHRIDAGNLSTACADACAAEGHKAILFGDLKDPSSDVSRELARGPSTEVRADLALNTGVRYRGIS